MRVGDLTTEMIGKSITIRDSDDGKSSPAWLLRGQLVGIEHRMEPDLVDPVKTATKVSVWIGSDQQTVTELVLPSDYACN